MGKTQDIDNLLHESLIKAIVEKYGVTYIGIFGSTARGEDHEDSDLDILVEFNRVITLFQHTELQNELQKQLNRKVDLVERRGVRPHLLPNIINDLITIYKAEQ